MRKRERSGPARRSGNASLDAAAGERVARTSAAADKIRRDDRARRKRADEMTPLDWRARHDPLGGKQRAVVRHGLTMADAQGTVSHPHRVFDTLAALHRRGAIDDPAYAAGERFRNDWERAHLDPLHAPALDRVLGGGSGGEHISERAARARDEIWQALRALGGHATPIGSAAWHVLGFGLTIKDFASRSQLGQGRALDERTARGLVIGACCVLAGHYGT